MQQRPPRQLRQAGEELEELLGAVAALLKPACFAIDDGDNHGEEEVKDTDDVVERAEEQAEDVDHADHRGDHEGQCDQEADDADGAVVLRDVGANLKDVGLKIIIYIIYQLRC